MFSRKLAACGVALLVSAVGFAEPAYARTDYATVQCEDPAIKELAKQKLRNLTAYDLGIMSHYDAPISSLGISFSRFRSFTTKYHDHDKLICDVKLYWSYGGADRAARGTFNISQFRDGHIETSFRGHS